MRWYSPNDWIPGRETEQEKEDLAKMRACMYRENEKGRLNYIEMILYLAVNRHCILECPLIGF